jgi:hypothetical protein
VFDWLTCEDHLTSLSMHEARRCRGISRDASAIVAAMA